MALQVLSSTRARVVPVSAMALLPDRSMVLPATTAEVLSNIQKP